MHVVWIPAANSSVLGVGQPLVAGETVRAARLAVRLG